MLRKCLRVVAVVALVCSAITGTGFLALHGDGSAELAAGLFASAVLLLLLGLVAIGVLFMMATDPYLRR